MGETVESTLDDLLAEIAQLGAAARASGDPEAHRRLLRLRHRVGILLTTTPAGAPGQPPEPAFDRVPAVPDALPEFTRADLDAAVLRAAILQHGCMLIRGLIDRDAAIGLAARVDEAFADREGGAAGGAAAYEPFRPDGDYPNPLRSWIAETGGLLLVDAPTLAAELFDLYGQAGIQQLAAAYLGEPVVLSVEKTTLRRVEPSASGAWHQDGSFMGSVPSLNLWLALSPCGVDAPGLDILPSRLGGLVTTGTDGAFLSTQVSDDTARRAAGSTPIVRPVFEPGDAVLFDELCLHQTAAHPEMSRSRLAVESWFFGGSAMPKEYTPVAPVVA